MFVRIVTVSVLVVSLGLHWTILQTVAWTGMILDFSRTASFPVAVAKTFDGEHPCALCKAIQKGRTEEKKREPQQVKPARELDPGLVWQPTEFRFACVRIWDSSTGASAPSRADEPPKPPPRGHLRDNRCAA